MVKINVQTLAAPQIRLAWAGAGTPRLDIGMRFLNRSLLLASNINPKFIENNGVHQFNPLFLKEFPAGSVVQIIKGDRSQITQSGNTALIELTSSKPYEQAREAMTLIAGTDHGPQIPIANDKWSQGLVYFLTTGNIDPSVGITRMETTTQMLYRLAPGKKGEFKVRACVGHEALKNGVFIEPRDFGDGLLGVQIKSTYQNTHSIEGYILSDRGRLLEEPIMVPYGQRALMDALVPTEVRDPAHKAIMSFILTGEGRVSRVEVTGKISNKSSIRLASIGKIPIDLKIPPINGLEEQGRLYLSTKRFGEGPNAPRGVIIEFESNDGSLKIPLASHILWERGDFLTDPRTFYLDLTQYNPDALPFTQITKIWDMQFMHFLAHGTNPPEAIVRDAGVRRNNIVHFYNFKSDRLGNLRDKSLPVNIIIPNTRDLRKSPIIIKPTDFGGGYRGVSVIAQTEKGEITLDSYVLFREDIGFLHIPERWPYGQVFKSVDDIPGVYQLAGYNLIQALLTGENIPSQEMVQVRAGGSATGSYSFKGREVVTHVNAAIPKGSSVLREIIELADGTRGVKFWNFEERDGQNVKLFPWAAYRLARVGEILSSAEKIEGGDEYFHYSSQYVGTNDPEDRHFVYWFATGEGQPPQREVQYLTATDGRETLFTLKDRNATRRKLVRPTITYDPEIINQGVIRVGVQFGPGIRGINYHKKLADGKPGELLQSYVVFRDGAFLASPEPSSRLMSSLAQMTSLDPAAVSRVTQTVIQYFGLPVHLRAEEIFTSEENQWTKQIRQTLQKQGIIYIQELFLALQAIDAAVDRNTVVTLFMRPSIKLRADIQGRSLILDFPFYMTGHSAWARRYGRILSLQGAVGIVERDRTYFSRAEVVEQFRQLAASGREVTYQVNNQPVQVIEVNYVSVSGRNYLLAFRIEDNDIHFYENAPLGSAQAGQVVEAKEVFRKDGMMAGLPVIDYQLNGQPHTFAPFSLEYHMTGRVRLVMSNEKLKLEGGSFSILDPAIYFEAVYAFRGELMEYLSKVIAEQRFLYIVSASSEPLDVVRERFEEMRGSFRDNYILMVEAIFDLPNWHDELKQLYLGDRALRVITDDLRKVAADLSTLHNYLTKVNPSDLPQASSREKVTSVFSERRQAAVAGFRNAVFTDGIEPRDVEAVLQVAEAARPQSEDEAVVQIIPSRRKKWVTWLIKLFRSLFRINS